MSVNTVLCLVPTFCILIIMISGMRSYSVQVKICLAVISSLLLTTAILLQANDGPKSCRNGSYKKNNKCLCDKKYNDDEKDDDERSIRNYSAGFMIVSLSSLLFSFLFCQNKPRLCFTCILISIVCCLAAIIITSLKSPSCTEGTILVDGDCSCIYKHSH